MKTVEIKVSTNYIRQMTKAREMFAEDRMVLELLKEMIYRSSPEELKEVFTLDIVNSADLYSQLYHMSPEERDKEMEEAQNKHDSDRIFLIRELQRKREVLFRLSHNPKPTIELLITDEEIDKVWGHANFGAGAIKRNIINKALLQVHFGFAIGNTIAHILLELGLIMKLENDQYHNHKTTVFGEKYIKLIPKKDK